jgi:hypothetical protein
MRGFLDIAPAYPKRNDSRASVETTARSLGGPRLRAAIAVGTGSGESERVPCGIISLVWTGVR